MIITSKIRVRIYAAIIMLAAMMLFPLPALSRSDVAPDLALKTRGVLTVCSYSEFTPVMYDEGKGYEADVLRAIAKLWHIKIRFIPVRVYEGIWLLPSRPDMQCDISAGGITPSVYRVKEGAVFTKTTASFKQSLLVRKKDFESGRITSYQSFKDPTLKIGVVPGTTGEKFAYVNAKDNGVPKSVFVQYPSEDELLVALRKGEIDAIARGEIGNEYQSSIDNTFVTIAKRDFDEGFSFAVNNSNKRLLKYLNAAIDVVTDDHQIGYTVWLKNHRVFMQRLGKGEN